MKFKLTVLTTLAFAIAGCTTPGKIQRSDPRYAKIAECGANIGIFIFADITLQVRLQNDLRKGDLSNKFTTLVEKQSEEHPSAEYLKVASADIGISGLRGAIDDARAGVADMIVGAKYKYGDDRVQVLEELLPKFQLAAQSACMSAGYQFTSIRRVSPPTYSQSTRNTVQATAALQAPAGIQQGEEAKLQEEVLRREAAKRKEQEIRDQQTAQRLEREQEAKRKEDAERRKSESKQKVRAMVRKATTHEKSMIINSINRTLFDSESAKYREIYLIQNSFACAEVNAKNRFGGYTGFQNIVATYIKGEWFSLGSLRDAPISCLDLIVEMHMKEN